MLEMLGIMLRVAVIWVVGCSSSIFGRLLERAAKPRYLRVGGWGFRLCHEIPEAIPVAPGESWRRGAFGFARSLGLEWLREGLWRGENEWWEARSRGDGEDGM